MAMGSLRTFLVAGARAKDLAPRRAFALLLVVALAGNGATPVPRVPGTPGTWTLRPLSTESTGLEEELRVALAPQTGLAVPRAGMEEGTKKGWWDKPLPRRTFLKGGGQTVAAMTQVAAGSEPAALPPPSSKPLGIGVQEVAWSAIHHVQRITGELKWFDERRVYGSSITAAQKLGLGDMAAALTTIHARKAELDQADGGPALWKHLQTEVAAYRTAAETWVASNLQDDLESRQVFEKYLKAAPEGQARYEIATWWEAMQRVCLRELGQPLSESALQTPLPDLSSVGAGENAIRSVLADLARTAVSDHIDKLAPSLAKLGVVADASRVAIDLLVGTLLDHTKTLAKSPQPYGIQTDRNTALGWAIVNYEEPAVLKSPRWRAAKLLLTAQWGRRGVSAKEIAHALDSATATDIQNWFSGKGTQRAYREASRRIMEWRAETDPALRGQSRSRARDAIKTLSGKQLDVALQDYPKFVEAMTTDRSNVPLADPVPWRRLVSAIARVGRHHAVTVAVTTDPAGRLLRVRWMTESFQGRAAPELLAPLLAARWPFAARPSTRYTRLVPMGTSRDVITTMLQALDNPLDASWTRTRVILDDLRPQGGLEEGPAPERAPMDDRSWPRLATEA